MTTSNATASQILRFAGMFTEVPRDRMNGIGFALGAILVKALSQPELRQLSLKTVHQVLGLPPPEDGVWVTVDWSEAQLPQHDGGAVFRKSAKQWRTLLARLRPTDVGLPNDAHPFEVIELATHWGYQVVPRRALDTLTKNNPPATPERYEGEAMVPLGDGQYTYLRIAPDFIREMTEWMSPSFIDLGTTWSVIMAVSTTSLAAR